MKTLYLLLCILGTLLPLSQFIPWLAENGLNIPLLLQHIAADRLSAFAWLDVLVSAGALAAFVVYENRRLKMRYGWLSLFFAGLAAVSADARVQAGKLTRVLFSDGTDTLKALQ